MKKMLFLLIMLLGLNCNALKLDHVRKITAAGLLVAGIYKTIINPYYPDGYAKIQCDNNTCYMKRRNQICMHKNGIHLEKNYKENFIPGYMFLAGSLCILSKDIACAIIGK